jgi:hypothetical protein
MKMSTLNKLPSIIRRYIIKEWNLVYQVKAIPVDYATTFLNGMITTLMLTDVLTISEYQEVKRYICQAFSL